MLQSDFVYACFAPASNSLTASKLRELTFERRVESKGNVVFGNAASLQLICNVAFGAVVLNPDFAVFDVEVEDSAIDSAFV